MTATVMNYYGTSVGKKTVMAVTGLVLFGFVTVHMLGNMQIYAGPEKLNGYAEFLHSNPALVWGSRLVLLLCLALHMIAALQLTLQSWAARPQRYVKFVMQETSYAARTMRWSGPILATFVVYHLLHFTVGSVHPTFQAGQVYTNVVRGFQNPVISVVYIVAMLALGLHMWHGVWSFLQTLGVNHPRYNRYRKLFSTALTLVVVVANISIPLCVLVGFLRLD